MNLQRSLVQNIRLRAMSVQAPTFSSSGDTENIVTKLCPNRIATMIITGKPNRPLPASYNLDLEEFLPGAISAVSVVTNAMAEEDWESLPGLVESRCVRNLRPVISALSPKERELTRLNSDDVFLSFISNPENCASGNDLKIVTFSLPQLGEAKSLVDKHKEAIIAEIKAHKECKAEFQPKKAQSLRFTCNGIKPGDKKQGPLMMVMRGDKRIYLNVGKDRNAVKEDIR